MNEDWTVETDLAERLAEDLGAFTVGSAPVGSVMGWGKAIKTRHRAARVGVLSVVAVAGVALPFLLRSGAGDVPPAWKNRPATAHHTVTVDPPQSASDGIPAWSGSIDGARWSVRVTPVSGSAICFTGLEACVNPDLIGDVTGTASLAAVEYSPESDAYIVDMDPAAVAADVYLDDGTDLRLQPAVYAGRHLAVFQLPHNYPIDRVVAHLPSGDRTAVAVNQPDRGATWTLWSPAGAVPDVPTTSGVIASRTGNTSASHN